MFVLCSLVSKLIFQSLRWHHSSRTEARSLCFNIWWWFLPFLSCIVTTLILRLLFWKAMIFRPCLQCVHAVFVLTRPAHLGPAYQTLAFCCRSVFWRRGACRAMKCKAALSLPYHATDSESSAADLPTKTPPAFVNPWEEFPSTSCCLSGQARLNYKITLWILSSRFIETHF